MRREPLSCCTASTLSRLAGKSEVLYRVQQRLESSDGGRCIHEGACSLVWSRARGRLFRLRWTYLQMFRDHGTFEERGGQAQAPTRPQVSQTSTEHAEALIRCHRPGAPRNSQTANSGIPVSPGTEFLHLPCPLGLLALRGRRAAKSTAHLIQRSEKDTGRLPSKAPGVEWSQISDLNR